MHHLRRFIDQVRGMQAGRNQELRLTQQQAQDLVFDITNLLLELERPAARPADTAEVVEIRAADW